MKPRVYLAGPITGLTYDDGQDWRRYAQERLQRAGIDGMSPLRGKSYLREFGVLSGDTDADYVGTNPLSDPAGVVTRDRMDCTKSNAVIFNLLGATRVSIGTVMEVAWADAARVPGILVMEPTGNPHDHMMLTTVCGYRVETLDEALILAHVVLLP